MLATDSIMTRCKFLINPKKCKFGNNNLHLKKWNFLLLKWPSVGTGTELSHGYSACSKTAFPSHATQHTKKFSSAHKKISHRPLPLPSLNHDKRCPQLALQPQHCHHWGRGQVTKFGLIARKIQNRVTHCYGLVSVEARLFCNSLERVRGSLRSYGSCSFTKVSSQRMAFQSISSGPFIFKGVPQAGLGCVVVSTSNGTIDRKTHCKWVWAIVKALADLEVLVVSVLIAVRFLFCPTSSRCVASPLSSSLTSALTIIDSPLSPPFSPLLAPPLANWFQH